VHRGAECRRPDREPDQRGRGDRLERKRPGAVHRQGDGGQERRGQEERGRGGRERRDGADLAGQDGVHGVAEGAAQDREAAQRRKAVSGELGRAEQHHHAREAQHEPAEAPHAEGLVLEPELCERQRRERHHGHEDAGRAARHLLLPPADEQEWERAPRERHPQQPPPDPARRRQRAADRDADPVQEQRGQHEPRRGQGRGRHLPQRHFGEEEGRAPEDRQRGQERPRAEARLDGAGARPAGPGRPRRLCVGGGRHARRLGPVSI